MDAADVTTRRAFLRRLPHLAAGGALVVLTLGVMGRGEESTSSCNRPPNCRSCALYGHCGLPRARQERDPPGGEASDG